MVVEVTVIWKEHGEEIVRNGCSVRGYIAKMIHTRYLSLKVII